MHPILGLLQGAAVGLESTLGAGIRFTDRPAFPVRPCLPLRSPRGLSCLVRRVVERRQAFSIAAPQLWNYLPGHQSTTPSLTASWRRLKAFLFCQALNGRLLRAGPPALYIILYILYCTLYAFPQILHPPISLPGGASGLFCSKLRFLPENEWLCCFLNSSAA